MSSNFVRNTDDVSEFTYEIMWDCITEKSLRYL